MTDAAFTVKVDTKTFVLDRITLGDWRMFKTEFGLNASDIITEVKNSEGQTLQMLNFDDPNVLVGLMTAALHHERPLAPISTLVAEVEALPMDALEFPGSETPAEPEADAAPLAVEPVAVETAESSPSGNLETAQPQPGLPS